jgi:uncharacterized protein YcgL (UPF0745 family)
MRREPGRRRDEFMLCHIYRSNLKLDTYLYIAERDDFSEVPAELLRVFGTPEYSFSFDLEPDRRLAREDATEVLANLESKGYHLQLQADELIEELLARKATN